MSTPMVLTVSGPIPVEDLGVALMHEHLSVTVAATARAGDEEASALFDAPVSPWGLTRLREDPYASKDNCAPPTAAIAIAELVDFASRGGRTVVDTTGWNIGRDPDRLMEIADGTGLHVVMGTGPYLGRTHPEWLRDAPEGAIGDRIVAEWQDGVPTQRGVRVRPGIIGEIGVSIDFTAAEHRSLRGAAIAQLVTRLPLSVHLPAWGRLGHSVLDECESVGVNPRSVVLSHMDPSWSDIAYQKSLAARGCYIEFDSIGMGIDYPGEGESPSDAQIAQAVVALLEAGFADRLLLSQDVFLKIQLRTYGGNGYAHVLRSFLPRLARMGVDPATCTRLTIENPRRAFEEAWAAQ